MIRVLPAILAVLAMRPLAAAADSPCVPGFTTTVTIFDPTSGGAWFPRLLERSSGEILCGYDTDSGGGPTRIGLSRSLDGGRTWTTIATVARSAMALANASLLEIPGGDLLCAYREVGEGAFAIRTSRSADSGRTWRPHGTVREGTRGLWEPSLLLGSGGAVLCAFASEEDGPAYPQVIEVRRSPDGGATWTPLSIAARSRSSRDGVPSLVDAGPAGILCFFEATDAGNPFAIRVARSRNGGLSWTGRARVYAPADWGRRAAAPSGARLRDGCILCAFYTDEDAAEAGDAHADLKWTSSRDGGTTWTAPEVLFASGGPDLWGTFLEMRDGRILAALFTAEGSGPRITVRRTSPAEPSFRRGDATADGAIDVSDGIGILEFLFGGGRDFPCPKAADADGSGELDISDAIFDLSFLFLGGRPPGPPSGACGPEPEPGALPCSSYPPCGWK